MREDKLYTKSLWGNIHLHTTMEKTNNFNIMKSVFDK